MPWSCPACHTSLTHNGVEVSPRAAVIYRCYVCRLELRLNEQSDKLELMPLPTRFERERDIAKSKP
jgi:hypothetical protein